MLKQHISDIRRGARCNNEVVLAAECWTRQLWNAVEAFWIPRQATAEDVALTLAHYQSFHRTFGIGSELACRPLVIFDDQNQTAPFSKALCCPLELDDPEKIPIEFLDYVIRGNFTKNEIQEEKERIAVKSLHYEESLDGSLPQE